MAATQAGLFLNRSGALCHRATMCGLKLSYLKYLKKLYTELATMEAKVKGERESRGGEERRRMGQEGGTSLRASLHARPCSPAHCRSSLNRART